MKKSFRPKTNRRMSSLLSPKLGMKKAYISSVQRFDEQCTRLPLLDPTEMEPALLFSPWKGKGRK